MKKPVTANQARARKGKSCVFTSLKNSCGHADPVEVEGLELRICAFHLHNMLAIVADEKVRVARQRRLRGMAA